MQKWNFYTQFLIHTPSYYYFKLSLSLPPPSAKKTYMLVILIFFSFYGDSNPHFDQEVPIAYSKGAIFDIFNNNGFIVYFGFINLGVPEKSVATRTREFTIYVLYNLIVGAVCV